MGLTDLSAVVVYTAVPASHPDVQLSPPPHTHLPPDADSPPPLHSGEGVDRVRSGHLHAPRHGQAETSSQGWSVCVCVSEKRDG